MNIASALALLGEVISPQRQPKKIQKPYILEEEAGEQGMVFYGSEHILLPAHPQCADIEQRFRLFVDRFGAERTHAFVEIRVPESGQGKEEMITTDGERGLLAFLCKQRGVSITCPEPTSVELLECVRQTDRFQEVDLALWIFLNVLFTSLEPDGLLKAGALKSLSALCSFLSMHLQQVISFPILSTRLHQIAPELVLPKIEEDHETQVFNRALVKDLQDPYLQKTVVNDVGSTINQARDAFIAGHLLEALKAGKNVFAIFGANHAVAQEPLLKQFFQQKKAPAR